MKTELKHEILNAFNNRIEAIVDGQPGGMFFVEEAIELAKAEEAVERILNIPHSDQCLVDRYLYGFMRLVRHYCEVPVDHHFISMIYADASDFFYRLDHRIDEMIVVLLAGSDDERLLDVEPDELVKKLIERVYREMEADVEAAGEDGRMRQKLEAAYKARPKDDDDDTEGIPF
ncbi:hypothetical protein [Escherichia coli]|uniref:hypothetical protein n=1 Tax=Escherichia coli TaxID=562 RepID=UPI00054242CD|nr:hypothetical protein [Escherichia coli]KHI93879.1 hypothetical protein PU12_19050 [Escherichia coli]